MDETCSSAEFQLVNQSGWNHLKDIGLGPRMKVKWILLQHCVRLWTLFNKYEAHMACLKPYLHDCDTHTHTNTHRHRQI